MSLFSFSSDAVQHFTLRLLLNEVVLYTALVLLCCHLGVAETVAYRECHTVDRHLYIIIRGEVLAAAACLNVQISALVQSQLTRNAQV